ncbi:DUF2169 family type VI secretion system accessory protein [Acidisoma sp. C75]
MLSLTPNPKQLASFVTRARAEDYMLTVVYVARARIVPHGACLPLPPEKQPGVQKSKNFEDGLGNSPRFAGDFIPFKPRTDVTLAGSAHAPRGSRTTRLDVTLGVGAWRKSLTVIGNRAWHRGAQNAVELSPPEPFSAMQIRLEHAYGGIDSPINPWGKGYGRMEEKPGAEFAACNIHPVNEFRSKWNLAIPPDTFGPLSPEFPPRLALRGTYDKTWLYKRSPLPPLDFDWGHYNAAPADQQFDPYLRGDELLSFENLHPDHPSFTARLPGLRARIFLRREVDEQRNSWYEEVPARLDSVHLDTDAMTVDLAWRAVCSTADEAASDVRHGYVAEESLAEEPAPAHVHIDAFRRKLEGEPPAPPPALPLVPPEDPERPEPEEMVMQGMRDLVESKPFPPEFKAAMAKAKSSEEMLALLRAEGDRTLKVLQDAVAAVQRGAMP